MITVKASKLDEKFYFNQGFEAVPYESYLIWAPEIAQDSELNEDAEDLIVDSKSIASFEECIHTHDDIIEREITFEDDSRWTDVFQEIRNFKTHDNDIQVVLDSDYFYDLPRESGKSILYLIVGELLGVGKIYTKSKQSALLDKEAVSDKILLLESNDCKIFVEVVDEEEPLLYEAIWLLVAECFSFPCIHVFLQELCGKNIMYAIIQDQLASFAIYELSGSVIQLDFIVTKNEFQNKGYGIGKFMVKM